MDDHSYLERLRELTSEFAQEQNPLKREEILEGILSLVATRAGAQETFQKCPNPMLKSGRTERNGMSKSRTRKQRKVE